jgi:hypothetical protein
MILEYRLDVLECCIEVITIDRGIVVALLLGKAMRKIAAAAGIHELALAALRAKIDRSLPRRFPARFFPYIVKRILEDVEGRLRYAIAGDSQNVVRFYCAIGHHGAKFDGLVADALGRRVIAEECTDHVGDDADADGLLEAICLQPQVELCRSDGAPGGRYGCSHR